MAEQKRSTATSVLVPLVASLCIIGFPVDRAAAQARGVIIQIPDDVAPGSSRPAAPPPVQTPQAIAPAPGASAMAVPPSVCQGPSCTGRNVWHVLNTTNRTCLVLSRDDIKGGKDVRRLSALLPAPQFVVASGLCP